MSPNASPMGVGLTLCSDFVYSDVSGFQYVQRYNQVFLLDIPLLMRS
jgi:hypothetical protein